MDPSHFNHYIEATSDNDGTRVSSPNAGYNRFPVSFERGFRPTTTSGPSTPLAATAASFPYDATGGGWGFPTQIYKTTPTRAPYHLSWKGTRIRNSIQNVSPTVVNTPQSYHHTAFTTLPHTPTGPGSLITPLYSPGPLRSYATPLPPSPPFSSFQTPQAPVSPDGTLVPTNYPFGCPVHELPVEDLREFDKLRGYDFSKDPSSHSRNNSREKKRAEVLTLHADVTEQKEIYNALRDQLIEMESNIRACEARGEALMQVRANVLKMLRCGRD
ncbi:hypothetical protein DL93DRAFT_2094572 [Clavulina sp. PMI_390]|nr:hypothetical protein DL93DRAFT_2094572 [Clavulina sp. PMI_390]